MKKTPASKFFKTFKEAVAPMSHEPFQRVENEGTFSNSFYVIRIILITKSDKNIIRKLMINLLYANKWKIILKCHKIEFTVL